MWRRRGLRIALYAMLLGLLVLYGKLFHPDITLQMCLNEPERHDGAMIDVGNEAVVAQVFADGFSIVQLGKTVRVFGPTTDVAPGEFVTLKAVFHKPAQLDASAVRIAKNRREKIWLSVVPAVVIVAFFIRRFRFNRRAFYFEER